MPRNPLDLATPILAGALGLNFLGESPGGKPLGEKQGFELSSFIGEGQATKSKLDEIFRGKLAGGAPSVVFTGSHGAEWPLQDPALQKQRQGALVTQEWSWGQPLRPDQYFSGADVPENADMKGTILFLFACFGSGTPVTDTYFKTNDGLPLPLAPAPIVASLPQRLLAKGALAVIGHVDRAFSYGFEDAIGTPQPQLLRSPLEYLMQGKRVGVAADPLNLQWSALAAQLGLLLSDGSQNSSPAALANLYIARDDARNYMVLGDPAVRLRTSEMAGN
jgi:hypothetical protein